MELVGDLRVTDPIFKGCYGDSLLYTSRELDQLRWQGIHLALYRGKIPTLPAPSYQQARQPKVMKRSPPRAVTPSPPVESPKAKHSGGKGSAHCGLGRSSNTSTLKCPTLLPPRSLPVLRSQPQMARRGLLRCTDLASMAVLPPHPPN